MVENAIKIENVLIRKGKISLSKDNKKDSNSNSNKDKSKWWNKNKNVVTDGVVDQRYAPPKVPAFNLTMGTYAPKAVAEPKQSNPTASKSYPPWNKNQRHEFDLRREFTPLRESLESVMRQLLDGNIIYLPEYKEYDPHPRPSWWKENDFC